MKLGSNEFSTCSLGKETSKKVRCTSAENITATPKREFPHRVCVVGI